MRTLLLAVALFSRLVIHSHASTPPPMGAEVVTYATVDPAQQQMTATYAPARHGAPWVMLIHGGSWIHGSELNMTRATALFSRHGWQVFNLSYRMGADVTYAEQLADLRAARDWIKAHAARFGADPARGAVYGFSAGGELAAAVGGFRAVVSVSGVLQPQRVADDALGKRPATEPATAGVVNLYSREVQMMGCPFAGLTGPDPCAQAWRAFTPELALQPSEAFYLVQGDDDPVVPPPTAGAFAYHVRAGGGSATVVSVPGYGHDDGELLDSTARTEAMLRWVLAHVG